MKGQQNRARKYRCYNNDGYLPLFDHQLTAHNIPFASDLADIETRHYAYSINFQYTRLIES